MSTLAWLRRRLRLRRREDGAVAILVVALSMMLLMLAALSVDIGLQVNKKHQLRTTLDSAAQAGASKLPGSTTDASTTALSFAAIHDPTATGANKPNVDFWCVVASTGTTPYAVDTSQIPTTCNPGTSPYTVGSNYKSTGRKITCSAVLCAIPCVTPTPNNASPPISCNTIRVYQGRDVPFTFAPAGGISKGSTGSLVSVACKGSCGTVAPNPLDVAIIADRTVSMTDTDVASLITGIKGTLQQMTPSQQYVALGAIGRSVQTTTRDSGSCTNSATNGLTYPSGDATKGSWLPVAFSNTYASTKGTLTATSTLVKAVECLTNRINTGGTTLALPVKKAARYLLGLDANNLSNLPTRSVAARKVLILETDGQPFEQLTTGGSTSLSVNDDIASHYGDNEVTDTSTQTVSGNTTTINRTITHTYVGGRNACNNLKAVAADAKSRGIVVITIGYNMTGKRCGDYDGGRLNDDSKSDTTTSTTTSGSKKTVTNTTTKYVDNPATTDTVINVLAASASPVGTTASVANNDCSTTALRSAENTDGDYFFCAASGTDMATIFTTALGQASSGIKLINMPGA